MENIYQYVMSTVIQSSIEINMESVWLTDSIILSTATFVFQKESVKEKKSFDNLKQELSFPSKLALT